MAEIIHMIGHIVGTCSDSISHPDLLDISRIPIIDLIKIIDLTKTIDYGSKK